MKIKLNNIETEVTEGENLFEIARRNGIEIPALCYAAGYRHQSSCMVCVVKDLTSNQIIPACSTLVVEGMEIDTECDEVKELRIMSLELLLSDHIAVCKPPCDVQKCKLRQYAVAYRAKWNRYPRYSALKATQPQHINGDFWFDVAKCIRCGLCVYNSQNGFTFKDRGFGMQVVLPEESVNNVDESLIDICPTQALYKIIR
jgi:NADH dehydrogenase/NADH:ubiquinone oxidoreductase subunit G